MLEDEEIEVKGTAIKAYVKTLEVFTSNGSSTHTCECNISGECSCGTSCSCHLNESCRCICNNGNNPNIIKSIAIFKTLLSVNFNDVQKIYMKYFGSILYHISYPNISTDPFILDAVISLIHVNLEPFLISLEIFG